jgi:pimeloyl-ACP methyl ester carboxylesterase
MPLLTGYATSPPRAAAVVFVADGAGDFRTASHNLSCVVAETRVPLQVQTVHWSTGYKRVIADQVNRANHVAQGQRLAAEVLAVRERDPKNRICLLGHSAGCAVILSAADCLPPNMVDRIVLLSPSVSVGHDLCPALEASREGIDHFYSKKDRWVLGLGMRIVGTTDGGRLAAGRIGFRRPLCNPTDELNAKLRQYPWDRSVIWTGHRGRHLGNLEPVFLRAYVLPMLAAE